MKGEREWRGKKMTLPANTVPSPTISIPDTYLHPDCQMTDPGRWAAWLQTSDLPCSTVQPGANLEHLEALFFP